MKNFMKKTIAAVAAAALSFVSCSGPVQEDRISIFCDHIVSIAQQEGISFTEAAGRVRDMGYDGVDVEITIGQDMLDVLDSLGFAHACAIAHINYVQGPQPEMEDMVLQLMKERGYERLLIVTDLLREGGSPVEDVVARVAAFTERLSAAGFVAMVEDFDNPASPCYNTADMDRMFASSEKLGHAYDTGNYLYAGEDCMVALDRFADRVAHVHLKDRVSAEDLSCPAVGAGCIPMEAVIAKLRSIGYDGWLTVEHYGSRHMLDDAEASYANLTAILKSQR